MSEETKPLIVEELAEIRRLAEKALRNWRDGEDYVDFAVSLGGAQTVLRLLDQAAEAVRLREYAVHKKDCDVWKAVMDERWPCTCGLSGPAERGKAYEKETPGV